MLRQEPGSYRDRDGSVFYDEHGLVLRGLSSPAWQQWETLASSPCFHRWVAEGKLVRTERHTAPLPAPTRWAGVLEHERIPFITYPYEWSFGMHKDAALLHLELLTQGLAEDLTLKDGTAYNVQFRGVRPVFIDVASFETLIPDQPWAGYRQFCKTMLFPLMLQAYKNVPFQPWLRGRLEGITPQECWNLMSFRDFFRRGIRTHVWLHSWLQSSPSIEESQPSGQLRQMGFRKEMLAANFQNLTRVVHGLEWRDAQSNWSEYEQHHSYTSEDRLSKEAFVRRCVATRPWALAWDIGCNTGTFSRIAAENAKQVVSLDADHLCVERFYQALKLEPQRSGGEILPLVSNLADQVAGLGWRGRERSSLLDRGRPDLVLSLALIHHLVIGCSIPLTDLLEWLAEMRSQLVIEFVAPEDPMASRLLSRRGGPCPDYTRSNFEQELGRLFEVTETLSLCHGTRTLYWAQSRCPAPSRVIE